MRAARARWIRWGLVAKGASWYLVARSPDGLRTCRVSHMRNFTALAMACKRPPHFNLAAYWRESTERFAQQRHQYEAVLALKASAVHHVTEWWLAEPVDGGEPPPGGWRRFRIHFENEEQARFIALGLGPVAQVEAPAALRRRVLADARAVAESAD